MLLAELKSTQELLEQAHAKNAELSNIQALQDRATEWSKELDRLRQSDAGKHVRVFVCSHVGVLRVFACSHVGVLRVFACSHVGVLRVFACSHVGVLRVFACSHVGVLRVCPRACSPQPLRPRWPPCRRPPAHSARCHCLMHPHPFLRVLKCRLPLYVQANTKEVLDIRRKLDSALQGGGKLLSLSGSLVDGTETRRFAPGELAYHPDRDRTSAPSPRVSLVDAQPVSSPRPLSLPTAVANAGPALRPEPRELKFAAVPGSGSTEWSGLDGEGTAPSRRMTWNICNNHRAYGAEMSHPDL